MQGSIKAGFLDLLVKSGEVLPTHQEQWLQGDGRREREKGPLRDCPWTTFVELKGIELISNL